MTPAEAGYFFTVCPVGYACDSRMIRYGATASCNSGRVRFVPAMILSYKEQGFRAVTARKVTCVEPRRRIGLFLAGHKPCRGEYERPCAESQFIKESLHTSLAFQRQTFLFPVFTGYMLFQGSGWRGCCIPRALSQRWSIEPFPCRMVVYVSRF